MPKDVLLVTVECWRRDHADAVDLPAGFDVATGYTPGHYTRPSLAGLLSGQYRAAAAASVTSPTLPEVFRRNGYHTIGISHSPQTSTAFGFDTGFAEWQLVDGGGRGALGRGSHLRERLAEVDTVRRLYRRLKPKHATLSAVQPDAKTVKMACDAMAGVSKPVFAWVHLMDSHRPYGRGDDALPVGYSRRAAHMGEKWPLGSEPANLQEMVAQHYRQGLQRVSGHLGRLVDSVSDDAVVVICGDHGEELGEHGYYFHSGYRRRVVDELVRVPVATRNMSIGREMLGLIDVPPLLMDVLGEDSPADWDGSTSNRQWLTVAPWNERATIRYSAPSTSLVFEDAALPDNLEIEAASRDISEQLEALGYVGAG